MNSIMSTNNLLKVIDQGIMVVDQSLSFNFINDKAKDILGISFKSDDQHHDGGKIELGDIIIIADNRLGEDDGEMTPKDLSYINIKDKRIKHGDALIAIGVYQNPSIKPHYKSWRASDAHINYHLVTTYMNFDIEVTIDELNKKMIIKVNDQVFSMSYYYSIGHMVVIDGKLGHIKFYQSKGYSYRKESIKDLLNGHAFLAKQEKEVQFDIIGKNVQEVLGQGDFLDIVKMGLEQGRVIRNQVVEMNGRPLISSSYIIDEGNKINGVIFKIESLSDIHDVLKLRNDVVKEIIKTEEHIREKIRNNNAQIMTGMAGNSVYMRQVKHLGYKASQVDSTVLITGESGTGKSLLAKEIHRASSKKGRFIHVNCGAIPDNLFESELFGYVKGSFSGALNTGKEGYFQLADQGTIFLDEIGEIPMSIQSKLLHVLQEKAYYKIGDVKPTLMNARVIAATNIDLEEAIKNNTFRQDLYYRINVFPIHIPPIRDRKKDLYVLINNIIDNLVKKFNCEDKQLSGHTFDKIMNYDWPGNVRELENALERAVIISETNIIYPEHINVKEESVQMLLKDLLEVTEKQAIIDTLEACNYNNKITMRKLGISKSAYYEKLKKYDLHEFR